jgi:hypothetical protein
MSDTAARIRSRFWIYPLLVSIYQLTLYALSVGIGDRRLVTLVLLDPRFGLFGLEAAAGDVFLGLLRWPSAIGLLLLALMLKRDPSRLAPYTVAETVMTLPSLFTFLGSAMNGLSIAELPVPYAVCFGCSLVPLIMAVCLHRTRPSA